MIIQLIQEKLKTYDMWLKAYLTEERQYLQRNDFAAAKHCSEIRFSLTIKHLALEELLQEIKNSAPAEPAGVLSLRAGDTEPIAEASDARRK